jgi:hypothetical protein
VDGRETGQWHEAELAVAHWLQHSSRDGDMQLHVHSQIAHTAKTVMDGKWRAPDSYGYNEHIGAVAAVVSQHLEEALARRFGIEWVARDDGHGFEIAGIPGERCACSARAARTTRPRRSWPQRSRRGMGASHLSARPASWRRSQPAHTQRQAGWRDRLGRLREGWAPSWPAR